jgi:hypothetical protein
MDASEASYVGTRLDDHHTPETNGRMSVCRRCGTQTDGAEGLHHKPSERQLERSNSWLMAQFHQGRIDSVRELRATDTPNPSSWR